MASHFIWYELLTPDADGSQRFYGGCAWNELATDPARALTFCTRHFGWTDGGSMPMGEGGDYQFINDEDGMIGAIMGSAPGNRPSLWTYYCRVPKIDAGRTRIEAGGGAIMFGPQEVPGGDHILIGRDPQGAVFALLGAQ